MLYKLKKIIKLFHAILTSIIYKNNKVAVCCIAKSENDYIREFVDYYKKLGFDNVYIYDNNDLDGELFEDVISDYINSGFCKIINYRGKKKCQVEAYQNFYDNYGFIYDWIAYLDVDEFLTFVNKDQKIHSFLTQKKFIAFQAIHINWLEFGDSNQLDNDGRNVVERLTEPITPIDFKCSSDRPENDTIKTIIRGRMPFVNCRIHNSGSYYMRYCDSSGHKCDSSPFNVFNYDVAYIRHYTTKTIGEWIRIKQKRGYPDMDYEQSKQYLGLDHFFLLNKYTLEKDLYAKSIMSNF